MGRFQFFVGIARAVVYHHAQYMSVRRERLITAFELAVLAAPCYAVTWALDGDEPVVDQFRNGVGLADVVGVVAAFGAGLFGLAALNYLLVAALGEKWEIGDD